MSSLFVIVWSKSTALKGGLLLSTFNIFRSVVFLFFPVVVILVLSPTVHSVQPPALITEIQLSASHIAHTSERFMFSHSSISLRAHPLSKVCVCHPNVVHCDFLKFLEHAFLFCYRHRIILIAKPLAFNTYLLLKTKRPAWKGILESKLSLLGFCSLFINPNLHSDYYHLVVE